METKINIEYLKNEIYNYYNNDKLKWYILNFNEQEKLIHEIEWTMYVLENKENLLFFSWLQLYCIENNIEFPSYEEIHETTNINKKYIDLDTKETITSIHPQKIDIFINKKYVAIPLSKDNGDDKKCLSTIIYQKNYTNEILNTIGQQLIRIENCKSEASTSQVNQDQIKIEENLIFIPHNIKMPINLGKQDELLQEIEDKLSKLQVSNINEENSSDEEEDIINLSEGS